MFESVDFVRTSTHSGFYVAKDTDFDYPIKLKCTYGASLSSIAIALIRAYIALGHNPADNIARYYVSKSKGVDLGFWVRCDRNHIDSSYPQLEYGKKYYKCVLNKIKVHKYSGRYT